MLDRRVALRNIGLGALALSPLLLSSAPAAGADPDEGDDDGSPGSDGPVAGNNGAAPEDAAPEDNGHRPLGVGAMFTAQGVKVEVAAVSCALVPGSATTPTGGKLWQALIRVHVISGQSPEVYLPGTFNFRGYYGDEPFQFYYTQYSGAADSLSVIMKDVKIGSIVTGKVTFLADRGPITALGLFAGSVSRFAPTLFWDV